MADTTDTAPPLTIAKAFNNTPAAPATQASGGRNWLRLCSLTVGTGSPIDLSKLRVRFETISHTAQELASANIIISNVSQQTYAKLQKEFTSIILQCGYRDGSKLATIFSGTITESQYGEREGWTDPLLRIWAKDGDKGYNQAHVSATLAVGATPQDIVKICLAAMAPFGITMGQVVGVDLSTPKFPRGYVLAGMARDYLREVALSKKATWNINAGKLNIIAANAAGTGAAVILNSNTGMIGKPIQRETGIMVRCLINPSITVDSQVQINQKSIVQTVVNNPNVDNYDNDLQLAAQLQDQGVADGIYRVLQVRTEGDTRGQPWYMDLTLIGATTGTPNNNQLGMGLG